LYPSCLVEALAEIRRLEALVIRRSHLQPQVFHDWLGAAEEFARSYPNVEHGDLCLQVIHSWIRPIPELQSAGQVLSQAMERLAAPVPPGALVGG
jgi:hypothetical protein